MLNQFGRGKRQSIRAYRKFIEEGKRAGRRPELAGGGLVRSLGGWSKVLSIRSRGEEVEHDSRILGSGEFVHGVMRDAEEVVARQMRNRGRKSIEEIIVRMCRESGVSEKEVRSGNQSRKTAKVRAEIACFLSREMGISMAEIARRLGVGASAIAMAIRRKNFWGGQFNNCDDCEQRPQSAKRKSSQNRGRRFTKVKRLQQISQFS